MHSTNSMVVHTNDEVKWDFSITFPSNGDVMQCVDDREKRSLNVNNQVLMIWAFSFSLISIGKSFSFAS